VACPAGYSFVFAEDDGGNRTHGQGARLKR
jgi:hypothetical protein